MALKSSSKTTAHFKQDGGSRGPPLGERKKRSTASRRKRPRLHLEKPQAPFAARTAASAQRTPGAPRVRAAPRPPRSGLRRAEAVTFVPGVRAGAPQQGAIFPSLSRADAGGCAAGTRRGTHRPGEEGERRNRPSGRHSPRRSLAARARTPPRPGAPSAAAAGEGDRVKFTRERPRPPSLASPPTRRWPLPRLAGDIFLPLSWAWQRPLSPTRGRATGAHASPFHPHPIPGPWGRTTGFCGRRRSGSAARPLAKGLCRRSAPAPAGGLNSLVGSEA
ncbi:translation initiation factor IF-2-like [Choloepus didactylus]|uniref:translation initiation factor IF-2-like n=1 Tax=Choloepus didactylus TaxID=27675 RepID=UPI0018A01409|nr:translation initiation factor IF-2-like [Choloepus didactylus]